MNGLRVKDGLNILTITTNGLHVKDIINILTITTNGLHVKDIINTLTISTNGLHVEDILGIVIPQWLSYLRKEVDFEGLPDESFNLTVRVEDIDSSHFDLSFVHVKILDSNDNPPLIAPIHHKTDVHENVSIGTQLFKFSASDPDTESGGMFRSILDIECRMDWMWDG